MIKIYSYSERHGANIALKYRLYVTGWLFYRWFKNPLSNIKYICIAWENEEPIGCAVISCDNLAGVFVAEVHRSKGVGRELLNYMTNCSNIDFELSSGCRRIFYEHH